jgi:hypothetical protein
VIARRSLTGKRDNPDDIREIYRKEWHGELNNEEHEVMPLVRVPHHSGEVFEG